MTDDKTRRPLKSRGTAWSRALTEWAVARGITPNRISQASMVFAALAGLAFWAQGPAEGLAEGVLLVLAALGCQLRLLCNLIDGMVAVEAGQGTPDGAFWNEFPDRVSDVVILVGLGYGVGAPGLGWAAAAMAVLTAYIREHGAALGTDPDFAGPMAKPHRMALVTAAALLALAEGAVAADGTVLTAALWIVALGAGLTALRRAVRLCARLRAG